MRVDLILLIALVLGLLVWLEALRARERALEVARRHCQRDGVQLLDETVGLTGLRLRRGAHGGMQLQRRYGFEVSLDGRDRHRGHLWMAAQRVIGLSTPWNVPDAADGQVIDMAEHQRRAGLPERRH